jgi:dipeptidyl aminopeptidase/acylaminoacyl peptidase
VFSRTSDRAVELWLGDVAKGGVGRLGDIALNPMLGSTVRWMPGSHSLLVKAAPVDAGTPPSADIGQSGPGVQETNGEKGESSTYEVRDVLTDKHSEALFDHYATSQLTLVDVEGRAQRIGAPAIFTNVDVAPDGHHILVSRVHRPYSYVTTYDHFPVEVEIWDDKGVLVHKVVSLPLADRVPVHGVPMGPRDFLWRATEPATLLWFEALDNGDWNVKVPARDKVMLTKAPFSAPPVEVLRTEQRATGIRWSESGKEALLSELDLNRHWMRVFQIDVDAGQKPKVLFDLSTDDGYHNPGTPLMRQLPNAAWVMREEAGHIYLYGAGASPEGDRPFFDRLDLATQKSERLFRSDKSAYERFLAFINDETFLTWHQTPIDPPNVIRHTLGLPVPDAPAGEATFQSRTKEITHLLDPAPAVRRIKKRLVKYQRKDGLELSFTLYTPPNYVEGTRVPAILYAYPRDYADPTKAGQVKGSPMTFTRLTNYRLLLLAGYALIDDASFPIVGDPKRAYDHYLEQLVEDARAAVDKAVEIGVVDRDRVGVTGHSHGALMTANLLGHSELFRAGVATSGAYNRTLQPFGFQNERRSLWNARDVYLDVSPYFFVDKLKHPLLIVHGAEDANPGTPPNQAQMLFEAIRGNGGTTRLVMLPHEPHWYSAMESNEQLAYEMIRWFDRYVKNARK